MFSIFFLYKNKVSPECTKIVFTEGSGLQQHVRIASATRMENLVLMQGKKAKHMHTLHVSYGGITLRPLSFRPRSFRHVHFVP
jgi:hypothetical protein